MSKEFKAFCLLYIKHEMMKHYGNPYWDTEEKTIENLGGDELIESTYYLWQNVPESHQRRIVGFSTSDVQQHLREKELGL